MRADGKLRRQLRRDGVLVDFDQTDSVNVNPLFSDGPPGSSFDSETIESAPLSPIATVMDDDDHVSISLQNLSEEPDVAEYDSDWGEAEKEAFVQGNQDLLHRGRFV